MRRVVTGHDRAGKSVFVSDEVLEPLTAHHVRIWAADELPTFPDDGIEPFAKGLTKGFFPAGPGGVRFWLFTLPPSTQRQSPAFGKLPPEVAAQLAGLAEVMDDPQEPGMHTTDTIDFAIVLSGRITLELDEGAQTTLGPGDVVIQNGTRHGWRNPDDQPAVVAAVMLGAHRIRGDR